MTSINEVIKPTKLTKRPVVIEIIIELKNAFIKAYSKIIFEKLLFNASNKTK